MPGFSSPIDDVGGDLRGSSSVEHEMRRAIDLPIKKACPLEGELPGTGAVRHCASCDTDVVDLSLLTADDATRTLADPARPRCVSYRVDDAGNVLHLPTPPPPPPPPPAHAPSRRRLPLLVGGLLLAACNGSASDPGTGASAPVAEVAAAASSSSASPPASAVPPAGSAEPTEKHTRGEIAAPSPSASGAGCDADQGATAAHDAQGNPTQPSTPHTPNKPKKPKTPMMRGFM